MSGGSPVGVVIRTPDQRLRVFVSSTLGELAGERRAVARAVSALRLTPVMFELGARPHPPRDVYGAYLAQSDVFIGLYWQRYGWIGPGMEISGVEDEFELARGMLRLLYVKAPAPDREPRLADLLGRIARQVSYRGFATPADLDEGLAVSLGAYSTQNVTLVLAAFAGLAFADGDLEPAALLAGAVEGLRRRAGLAVWPAVGREEADLAAQIRQAPGVDRFDQAYAAGARLNRRDAVAAARDNAPAPGRPEP